MNPIWKSVHCGNLHNPRLEKIPNTNRHAGAAGTAREITLSEQTRTLLSSDRENTATIEAVERRESNTRGTRASNNTRKLGVLNNTKPAVCAGKHASPMPRPPYRPDQKNALTRSRDEPGCALHSFLGVSSPHEPIGEVNRTAVQRKVRG